MVLSENVMCVCRIARTEKNINWLIRICPVHPQQKQIIVLFFLEVLKLFRNLDKIRAFKQLHNYLMTQFML